MNKKLFIFVFLLLIVGFFVGLWYGCVWRELFGFECPSCGISHAWLFALKGDFAAAFSMHPLFFFPPLLLIYCALNKPILSKKADALTLMVLGFGYLTLYITKFLNS